MSIYDRKIYGVLGYYEFKKRKISFSRVKFFDTKGEVKKFKKSIKRVDSLFQCNLLRRYKHKENVLKIRFEIFNNAYIALGEPLFMYDDGNWTNIKSNSIAKRFIEDYKKELVEEKIIKEDNLIWMIYTICGIME